MANTLLARRGTIKLVCLLKYVRTWSEFLLGLKQIRSTCSNVPLGNIIQFGRVANHVCGTVCIVIVVVGQSE